jgi:hypothetical protein
MEAIRTKIRALIEDWLKADFEVFNYDGETVLKMAQNNIDDVTRVILNGTVQGSASWDYDSTTNELTLTISGLTDGDIIKVEYNYNKYSDSELTEFIRAALSWISMFTTTETDYELELDDIYPTIDNRTSDLIAVVAAILIKPDYTQYKLPTIQVVYGGRIPKEAKIEKLITKFNMGLGVNDILKFD